MRQVSTRTPAVRRGKPLLLENYTTTPVSGITVWYPPEVQPENGRITISLAKRWLFRELLVSGVGSFVSTS